VNTSARASLNRTEIFSFPLDPFQVDALDALDTGASVVVSVPTGSGKTLVGEYAIHRAISRNRRVFYTTPLKALSNQKFRDFCELFGADQVGILTGDTSINRDASVLVMTTEIFRNMLYGTPIGQVGTSLANVEAVVLDECHYMNDSQRGTVWEESIIYCPPQMQIVALSATIANATELTEWISQVHGPTRLIHSDFRPVPLEFHFSTVKGLFPLLDDTNTRVNKRLLPKGKQRRLRREDCPTIRQTVAQLRDREMLPAIFFIFSRRGCDSAIAQVSDYTLITAEEAAELKRRVTAFVTENPSAARTKQVEPLMRGIASHHAGVLPAWKALVEELFQDGLVKVVFATETLAAGINMPARTTVISAISKRSDDGHRLLRAAEFLQMAGRAGRRGMDATGYVVTVQTRFEGAKDAANLALKSAEPLVSQFTPTYGMVLNLLQTHSVPQVKSLLERSFAQYAASLKLAPDKQAIAELTTDLAKLDVELAPVPVRDIEDYEKLRQRAKEERRLLKILREQALETRQKEITQRLPKLPLGSIFYLKGKHVSVAQPLPVLLVAQLSGRGKVPYYLCLTEGNDWTVVASQDVVGVGDSVVAQNLLDMLDPPFDLPRKLGQYYPGDDLSASVAEAIPITPFSLDDAPEVVEQSDRLAAVQAQLDNHALRQWGKPGQLVKRHNLRIQLQRRLRDRQAQYKEHQTQHWRDFSNLVKVLREFDALIEYDPTEIGQAAAAIRGDNELWLGLALMSGYLDPLGPPELAAAVYSLISESPRPDSWTNYDPPESTLIALANLIPLRKELIKVQYRYKVALPVWLEDDTQAIIGVMEQWALGVSWETLGENCSFDEGDLVRMLRRTVDFLSQIPHVPGISDTLRQNARRAVDLMRRFPIDVGI
jgi:superfamily II RNA helicase